MNNKKLGTLFEREVCELLAAKGYWVHFIVPDNRCAQPFDVIAVKNGVAIAIDCKTSCTEKFAFSRLEDNQVSAFELWMKCGNEMPLIYVKYNDHICVVPYSDLKNNRLVDLESYINPLVM